MPTQAAHAELEHLTTGQMKKIQNSDKTTRQLAIFYGVKEATIRKVCNQKG